MLEALTLAFAQLPEPGLRRPLLATLFWTLLAFALAWFGALRELGRLVAETGAAGPAATLGMALGIVVLAAASWFLFAVVENAILFCFADRIIEAVERRHYPELAPPKGRRPGDLLWSGLRLALLTLVGNLLALPLYVFAPGANLVLFLGLNGYLFGRGYFDTVALRRMDDRTARRLWREHRMAHIANGAVSALLLAVPLVNLVVPMVGLAATVHLIERQRRPAGTAAFTGV